MSLSDWTLLSSDLRIPEGISLCRWFFLLWWSRAKPWSLSSRSIYCLSVGKFCLEKTSHPKNAQLASSAPVERASSQQLSKSKREKARYALREAFVLRNAEPEACPAGFHCLGGASFEPSDADLKNIRIETGKSRFCPAGKFCEVGATEPLPDCPRGIICIERVRSNPAIAGLSAGRSDACPQKHFCREGTTPFGGTKPPKPWTKSCAAGLEVIAGTPSATTDMQCAPCRAGYFCPTENTATPVRCPSNSTCRSATTASSRLSFECVAGHYKSEPYCVPNNSCPPGLAIKPGGTDTKVECIDCPTGKYCPVLNTTVSGGSNPAIDCPSNSDCATGGLSLTSTRGKRENFECNPGFYRSDDGKECLAWKDCAAGEIIKLDATPEVDRICAPCPNGLYCPSVNTSQPNSGKPNMALTCPENSTCALQKDLISQTDFTCSNKSYRTGNTCTTWKTCGIGEIVAAEPTNTTDRACSPCPAGRYCTTKNLKGDKTTACPANSTCEGSTTLVGQKDFECKSGYFRTGNRCTIWADCPVGEMVDFPGSAVDNRTCKPCAAGRYCAGPTPNITMATAKVCPPHSECATNGLNAVRSDFQCKVGFFRDTPTSCKAHSTCPPGTVINSDPTATSDRTCRPCPTGRYCPTPNLTAALSTACPENSNCAETSITGRSEFTCKQPGFFKSGLGCAAWSNCEAGKVISAEGSATSDRTCEECPGKKYCPTENTTLATAVNCPANSNCSKENKAELREDFDCAFGFYKDPTTKSCKSWTKCQPGQILTGQSPLRDGSCQACESGYVCKAESGGYALTQCPAGTECLRSGMSQAVKCARGKYDHDDDPTTACQACPTGTYCPNRGTTSSGTLACPSGKICGLGTSSPSACGRGTYCVPASSIAVNCQPGEWDHDNDSTTACQACPAGKYCSQARTRKYTLGTPLALTPRDCKAGYWCPASSVKEDQNQCASKKYCPTGSSIGSNDCPAGSVCSNPAVKQSCKSGSFCPTGTTVETDCPAGSVCATPASKAQCPAGKYCPKGTVTASKDCSNGSYCPVGSKTEKPCPAGSYCSNPKSKKSCSTGSICLAGSTTEKLCGVNTYDHDDKPSTACESAPQKTCESKGTKKAGPANCPIGYFCKKGTAKTQCGDGDSCPEGSSAKGDCGKGKISKGGTCFSCPENYSKVANNLCRYTYDGGHGKSECKTGTYKQVYKSDNCGEKELAQIFRTRRRMRSQLSYLHVRLRLQRRLHKRSL